MALDLAKAYYPFKSNYLDLNGLKYHYLDEGNGPTVGDALDDEIYP